MTNLPVPARQQRHTVNTEWIIPASSDVSVLQAAIDAATTSGDRGDLPVWYRTAGTANGPIIVIGYTSETIA